MLTPVHSNSSASRQLANAAAGTAEVPTIRSVAKDAPVKKLKDIDQLSQQIAKLANLLIGSQNGLKNPLLKLALAVAKAIDFQQRPDEKIEEFVHRLADFLLAMKPEEQAAVEVKSGLKSLAIPVVLLAEALKDTSTPAAAKLVVLIEKALTDNQHTLEDHVSHSYSPKSENRPDMADSLKYRGSAPQAAILSPHLQIANEIHAVSSPAKWTDIKSLQAQLVREFVVEVDRIAVSLDIETESPNLIETNYEEADPGNEPVALKSDFRITPDVGQAQGEKPQSAEIQPAPVQIPPKAMEATPTIPPVALMPRMELSEPVAPSGQPSTDSPVQDAFPFSEHLHQSAAEDLHINPPKPEPSLKSALLTVISERLARIARLDSKLADRVQRLVEPRMQSQETPHAEQKYAPLQQMKSVEKSTHFLRHEQINMAHLTTQFLKDLPKATLVKLQAIASMLEVHGYPFESNSPTEPTAAKKQNATKGPLPQPQTPVDNMRSDAKGDPLFAKVNVGLKRAHAEEPNALPVSVSTEEQDKKLVAADRHQLPASMPTPAERIAQQLAAFQTLAYVPLPYPIVDEPDHRSKLRGEEKEQEHDDRGDQEEKAGHDNPQQQSRKEEPNPDLNPFAPDAELKRHPSDAERAFHMYQKMGGF